MREYRAQSLADGYATELHSPPRSIERHEIHAPFQHADEQVELSAGRLKCTWVLAEAPSNFQVLFRLAELRELDMRERRHPAGSRGINGA